MGLVGKEGLEPEFAHEPEKKARGLQKNGIDGSALESALWNTDLWVDVWCGRPIVEESADCLLATALHPACTVNFPVITQICERATEHPAEAKRAVRLLVSIFADATADARRTLKALTIAHELLYDQAALQLLQGEYKNLTLPALSRLKATVDISSVGKALTENIRLLATEIEKRCFGAEVSSNPGGLRGLASTVGSAALGGAGRIGRVAGGVAHGAVEVLQALN